VDWANRLILGDSLQVMASLAKREALAGQVQMIYMDPPYGIRFSSNFQPVVGQRDVRDRPQDLTREPEMVKAYRDTWTLGVHSYLAYLRDRLIAARELLSNSGSIFLQIGDENVHLLRMAADEIFGNDNFISLIVVKKTSTPRQVLDRSFFYLLWYAKDVSSTKYRQLFLQRTGQEWADDTPGGSWGLAIDGVVRPMLSEEKADTRLIPYSAEIYKCDSLTSAGAASKVETIEIYGRMMDPGPGTHWKTTSKGMERLIKAERIEIRGARPWYRRFHRDYPVKRVSNLFDDTSGKIPETQYVVQTPPAVIERCILMTSDPGDLILDPTCGSGTTAYVAEQWGRRWITVDTSRVALAIARQRVLTATFDHYRLRDESAGPSGNFFYKTVPHITLGSIAQNVALDPIFAKHEPILVERLAALNAALAHVTPETRTALAAKLAAKERAEGKKAVTDIDRRRWLLPKDTWEEWQVPFDADPDWPPPLQDALAAYRAAWRRKMDEVNAVIANSAEHEELVDRPEPAKSVVRVSGPFTVEAVLPAEESLDTDSSPIDEPDEDLDTFASNGNALPPNLGGREAGRAEVPGVRASPTSPRMPTPTSTR
ncbi:MAG: site-specific DNA-methyltransferase, partial [Chloroflexota bacterium]|nr:site-specific DNA-methyltransferase [Chloroflexota bacterium]